MSRRTHTSFSSGFSLVELMVALAIGALLLGILGNILSGVMDTSKKIVVEEDEQEESMIAARLLNHFILSAVPPTTSNVGSSFTATRDAAEFYATPLESMLALGVVKVRLYTAADGAEGNSMFLDATPVRTTNIDRSAKTYTYRLIKNVASVAFEYTDDPAAAHAPSSSWADQSKLPALVRLSVVRTKGAPLSLSVSPRRKLNGLCRFDQIGFSCRT